MTTSAAVADKIDARTQHDNAIRLRERIGLFHIWVPRLYREPLGEARGISSEGDRRVEGTSYTSPISRANVLHLGMPSGRLFLQVRTRRVRPFNERCTIQECNSRARADFTRSTASLVVAPVAVRWPIFRPWRGSVLP